MDALGHSVTFPVNEMLLTDEGAASDSVVVNEMGGGGQPSFVFSSEGGTATLLSLPFALLHDSGLATLPTSATAGASTAAQPIGGTNTTNIIIKQSTSSAQPGLPTNTIFLDAAQMALLSSGEGQVVLTDAFLEEGQQGSEAQQIFFQVTSDALHEEDETAGQKEDGAMVQQPGMPLHDIRGRGQSIVIPERRPVLPKAKRGPGRPRRDDSKIMPPSVKGVWFCQSCGKEFSKWPLLKKHMKTHSDDKPHRCSHCPASFNVPWNLKLHESTHVSPTSSSGGPLRCPACTRTFSRIASLKAHVMLHEEDESLFCTQCGEEFSTQGALDDHLRIHEVEAHNIDPLADETAPTVGLENAVWLPDGSAHFSDAVHSFVSADQQVVSGMLTDSPRAGHRCRLCNAIFRKAGQLREHMKEHSKVKASLLRRNHKRNIDRSSFLHKCKNCSKGFQKPSQLVRHMRIHTGERPYKCSTCDRAFNQKGSLQIHMTKHSGVKPFTCEFCSAGFRQRGNLRAHILRVHTIPVTGEQAFRCCECPCVFRKLGSLNAHVSRVHGHSTSSGNGLSRKRKRADGSTVGDSLDDDVSDVLKDLAELEEATRGLGGGVGSADGRAQEAVRRGMV
ncbi:zinc finger protein 236-like, partial [Hetaerina americana]|uniref:zinc finger protein 236-like n=1 Tax=Hetaerina americana TaxID=62018 RepID=UPI003A7F1F91